ncbi:hypothetical protein [Streptomyces platensis]|uniref:hypothetical protein n=1 Tax=Streptomyces platensis TaxID=58346 RepID=UPI0036BABBCE
MGIKDQFQDKANELKGQSHKAMGDAREQGHERGQRQDQERGGQRPERESDRRQGGQDRGQQPRDRQQGRRPAQDAMDAAEGRFQS